MTSPQPIATEDSLVAHLANALAVCDGAIALDEDSAEQFYVRCEILLRTVVSVRQRLQLALALAQQQQATVVRQPSTTTTEET